MKELNERGMKRLRTIWDRCNDTPYGFPQNGEEARSMMRCFAEFSELEGDLFQISSTQRDAVKYWVCRQVAMYYGTDTSDLPEILRPRSQEVMN